VETRKENQTRQEAEHIISLAGKRSWEAKVGGPHQIV
jgi:hypothetical protein